MALNPFSAVAAKLYAGLFGATLALVAVQTIRIEGLWFITGLEDKLQDTRTNLAAEQRGRAADRAAWDRQIANAVAAKNAAEHAAKEIAIDAQASHESLLSDNAGLREYIASHRLQPGSATSAAASTGTGEDLASGLPDEAAAGTFVATSEADLHKCDADYAYAASAYEFGQELIARGLAR